MSDDRKKPVWPWITAMLIGLLVLYVGSFGPACWLCEQELVRTHSAWVAYRPVTWLCAKGPRPVRRLIQQYAKVWGDERRLAVAFFLSHRRADCRSPIDYELWHQDGRR